MSVKFLYLCPILTIAFAAGTSAQTTATVLRVDVENWVSYGYDVADPSVLAKTAGPVAENRPANFSVTVQIADIRAVNGLAAKGTLVLRTQVIQLTPNPRVSQSIADVTRQGYAQFAFEFLDADGNQIGSIFAVGLNGGSPAPGSPAEAVGGNVSIVGGTGAYAGVSGTINSTRATVRLASQAEDPSMRRLNGGGAGQFLLQVIPSVPPRVHVTPRGANLFHSDWTPVSLGTPAKPGETLILFTTGIGPTVPVVDAGEGFPSDPPAIVSSPVEVIVDRQPSPAINKTGVPGTHGIYRIDFRVPNSTASGVVPVRVRVAWLDGPPIAVPVR